MSSPSGGSERASSHDSHHENCYFHQPSHLCHFITEKGIPCNSEAESKAPGCPPVCDFHSRIQLGQCQAIEECGQLCNRLVRHDPPNQFCLTHQEGLDPLSCYIMRIPTETRLMIFRYLFPEVVPSNDNEQKVCIPILNVNRQLYQEASAVLYEESRFLAFVDLDGVQLFGKNWTRKPGYEKKDTDFSVAAKLSRGSTQRIRNLEVHVTFGEQLSPLLDRLYSHGIMKEDFYLYALRDSVRKLVDLFGPSSDTTNKREGSLLRLKVTVYLHETMTWSVEEVTAALTLAVEPFESLRGVKYPVLAVEPTGHRGDSSISTHVINPMLSTETFTTFQEKWADRIRAPNDSNSPTRPRGDTAITNIYQSVEAFTQLVHYQDMRGHSSSNREIFGDIGRPLHLARVAYENGDIEALDKIREAIAIRWIDAQRNQQPNLQLMANSINTMFNYQVNGEEGTPPITTSMYYPDAFIFGNEEPINPETRMSHFWLDLYPHESAPRIGTLGVTYESEGAYVYVHKDGLTWKRLKTPSIQRQISAMRANSQA